MKKLFTTVMLTLALTSTMAQQTVQQSADYVPTKENLEARKHFQDEKFGIFLHWGLYAMLATGEWTMHNADLNYKEYAKLAGGFYPSRFNAKEWVEQIKA